MGGVCKLKVCEIREVVDDGDERAGCDVATPQGEVQEGMLKGGVCIDLSEYWDGP